MQIHLMHNWVKIFNDGTRSAAKRDLLYKELISSNWILFFIKAIHNLKRFIGQSLLMYNTDSEDTNNLCFHKYNLNQIANVLVGTSANFNTINQYSPFISKRRRIHE